MHRLEVDPKKKKQIHKNYAKTNKVLYALPYIMLVAAALLTIFLLVYGYGNKDAFIVQDVTDSDFGKKNFMLLYFIIGTADVILLFLFAVIRTAVYGVYGRCISWRVNEMLSVGEGCLEYSYQNHDSTSDRDRVEVVIPFSEIRWVSFEEKTKKVVFNGKYSSMYYEDYQKGETRADDILLDGEFIIFDYFDPSLVVAVRAEGLDILAVR